MARKKCQAYVVFRGRQPGVYFTWDETKAQVDGFSGQSQQGFATLEEAEQRWQEHLDNESQKGRSSGYETSGKRKSTPIDLTGSDDENQPATKKAQHKLLDSDSRDSHPLGAFAIRNQPRANSDGVGNHRAPISEVPITPGPYVPKISQKTASSSTRNYPNVTYNPPPGETQSFAAFEGASSQRTDQVDIEEDPNIILTGEQEAVVSLALNGENLFLTGAGGSGKTVTLKTILARLKKRKKEYQVIAPTGIAALPLNGKTCYSFFGWQPDTLQKSIGEITETRKPWIEKAIQKVQVLIIEEISMVENQFLERMNLMMQAILLNDRPFGGKQVIFLGDFHQLPPVKPFEFCLQCGRKMTRLKTEAADVKCNNCNQSFEDGQKWAFKSDVWKQLNLRHVQLQQIHRQKDKAFQDILYKIRHGIMLSIEEWRILETRKQLPRGICAVRLMSMRKDVDALNSKELNLIKMPPKSWDALDTYRPRFEGPNKDSTPWLQEKPLENHRFPARLILKLGAKVVLLTNLDPKAGLVNGSQGEVTGFEPDDDPDEGNEEKPSISYIEEDAEDEPSSKKKGGAKLKKWAVKTRSAPIVRFANGVSRTIFAKDVTSRFGKSPAYQYLATRAQVPLALAWALTIHKSQGMTLNYIEVLSRDIFEKGQFYVALSRGTSLAGLTVTGYKREQLPVDSDVVEFYETTKWECFAPEFEIPAVKAELRRQTQDTVEIFSDSDDE